MEDQSLYIHDVETGVKVASIPKEPGYLKMYHQSEDGAIIEPLGSQSWLDLSSSPNGKHIAACYKYEDRIKVVVAEQDGRLWKETTINTSCNEKAILEISNAGVMALAVKNGYIFTSKDFGETWVANYSYGLQNWTSVSIQDADQETQEECIISVRYNGKIEYKI